MIQPTDKKSTNPPTSQPSTSISLQFFSKVPELAIIQQPFSLINIDNQLTVRDLDNQFQLLRAITETKKHKLGLRSNSVLQNKKNRYPEQSIYDHSRVLLNTGFRICKKQDNEGKQKRKPSKRDYINANYIFAQNSGTNNTENITIISQAPLQQTTEDFLTIIIENQITCVVMLCNVMENGKNKCYDYLNQSNLYKSVQNVPLDTILPLQKHSGIEVRKIRVRFFVGEGQKDQKVHQFYHLLFTQWPDKSVPENVQAISPIIDIASKHKKLLIHCSAGLGRSGVVAALIRLIKISEQQEQQQNTGSNQGLSVFRTVREMREDRYGAVQNSQQYRFIYQYLKYYKTQKN